MNKTKRYYQALDALVELKAELTQYIPEYEPPTDPYLEMVLENIGPLPKESLFLGQADDDLPVLLNLFDSAPGPLLIQADSGQGKSEYLKSIASAIEICHSAQDVQYGVITDKPEEWAARNASAHNIGVFPVQERITFDFMLSLNTWAHSNRSDQSVILLWDNLSSVNHLEMELVDNFRWLLLRGPAKKVWPIVTVNTSAPSGVLGWKDYFRTCINGRTQNPSRRLVAQQGIETLKDGYDFWMNSGGESINIWMPHHQASINSEFPLLGQ